ncbi:MAG: hypothetical protein QNJ29_07265 [Rhizobiaceae bacterium]|nr:hypothetical protein [Rhizobiaceae bacterium]
MRILLKLIVGLMVFIGLLIGMSLLPPIANPAIKYANQRLLSSDHYLALSVYRYYANFGNANAINNLGVAYYRGLGVKRDKEHAVKFFQRATDKGSIQGRYNLVLTMENRFKTDKSIVEKQIKLLEANVAAGDIHSHVLYARRLYFVNRDEFVPNRE